MTWRGTTTIQDRILASLPYLLPLMYGVQFGNSILTMFPALAAVLYPLIAPVAFIYSLVPFAGIIVFFALLLLVVRNERISHFIRFNTMQALLITIVLFLCQIATSILSNLGSSIAPLLLVLNNTIFLAVLIALGYTIIQTIRGHYADKIPKLSDAVYLQVQ